MRGVDIENGNRRPPTGSTALKSGAVPPEVPRPMLSPRIEEHNDPAGCRIDPAEVAGFRQVAQMAGPGKVVRFVNPAMLASDNVLEVKRKEGQIHFVQLTVPAASRRAGADEGPSRGLHAGWPRDDNSRRALACRMAMKSPARTYIS